LSLPALFSLLASIASPFFICICLPVLTVAGSLVGIVLGHIAMYKISRSGGRLSGSGLALTGLLLGYPVFLMALSFSLFGFFMPKDFGKPPPGYENTARARLEAAESKIGTDTHGIAHGNTPKAKELAEKYAKTMKTLRDALFTKGKEGISLSGGKFITYCELHEGSCVFITHVPEYRRFKDDAKDSLAEIAWEAAQKTVAEELDEGDDLAVGLKGVILYGSVMVGKVAAEGDEDRGPDVTATNETLLERFFKLEEDEMPQPNLIPLEEPAKPATDPAPK